MGRRILTGRPPPTSKYYQQHRSGGARHQAPGRPVVYSQGRPTRHWLYPVRRWSASEVAMSLMSAGRLDTNRRRRGGEGRGEHDRTGKVGGGGSGTFARG